MLKELTDQKAEMQRSLSQSQQLQLQPRPDAKDREKGERVLLPGDVRKWRTAHVQVGYLCTVYV